VSYQLTFGGGEAILIRDKGTANAVQGFVETDIVVSKNNTALTTSFLFDLDEYIQLAIQANVVTLPADRGTYTLTGNVLDLRSAFQIAATVAAFTLTGGDANFQLGKTIVADTATYTLTGNNAGTIASRQIAADKGTFVLTGIDANFQVVKSVAADRGTFVLTGNDAATIANRRIVADRGTFTLVGNAATIDILRTLVADKGTYVLTGNDATLQKEGDAVLTAERGTFILTGLDANLIVPLYSFNSNVTIQTEQRTRVTISTTNDYNVTITSIFES
jgi:hypothetical protein